MTGIAAPPPTAGRRFSDASFGIWQSQPSGAKFGKVFSFLVLQTKANRFRVVLSVTTVTGQQTSVLQTRVRIVVL